MAGKMTLSLDDKNLQKALKAMEKTDRSNALKDALRKGIQPVYSTERALISQHKYKGNLLRAMTKRLQASKQRIYVAFRRGGKSNNPNDKDRLGYHAHWLEAGATHRYYVSKKTGLLHYTGSVRAKNPQTGWHPAEKAFTQEGGKALDILISTIKKYILNNWK